MERIKTAAERKEARFWQRFFVGAELAERLRFITLNSSDESVVMGICILKSLSKLVKRSSSVDSAPANPSRARPAGTSFRAFAQWPTRHGATPSSPGIRAR